MFVLRDDFHVKVGTLLTFLKKNVDVMLPIGLNIKFRARKQEMTQTWMECGIDLLYNVINKISFFIYNYYFP